MLETVEVVRERERELRFSEISLICCALQKALVYAKTTVLVGIKVIELNRININKKDRLCISINTDM